MADGQSLKGHKFVLDARSKNWDSHDLSTISELDISDVNYDIGYNLIKWVYTDSIDNSVKIDEDFYLEMMKQADRFCLKELKLKFAFRQLIYLFNLLTKFFYHVKDVKMDS